jgi:crossover junction endodeoxyribonuclease RusA
VIDFAVRGMPQVQGNMRAVGSRVFSKRKPELDAWRDAIATEARDAMADRPLILEALYVVLSFRLQRPKGHTGRRGLLPSAPAYPTGRPDLDKLIRAALDAMTGVVWADDSQVFIVHAEKRWADADPPGLRVQVVPA